MSALYDFLPVPPKGNNESGSHLYPKLRPYKTVSFDELTEKIASHSGLTKGNILAVMEEIENWTKQLLSEGYCVPLRERSSSKVRARIQRKSGSPCFNRIWRATTISPVRNMVL